MVPATAGGSTAPGARDLRRAWWAVALTPAGLLLGTLVGEGVLALLGFADAMDRVPGWAVLVAAAPALLVLVAPAAGAVWFGSRAQRAGQAGGRTVVTVGLLLVVLLIGLNVTAYAFG